MQDESYVIYFFLVFIILALFIVIGQRNKWQKKYFDKFDECERLHRQISLMELKAERAKDATKPRKSRKAKNAGSNQPQ